ncbi:uroporphyrinogen-III synthase [Ancylobacter sp. SL191]|uniref:uroporphyrinogen-III synthase n=1 Tax=Ancylobacter sp. SL191 TaxID=2995166 RepID=UPI0022715230|nr:uroporphyrinogen-III synthase [Ancylobacter sp. SL191]WAC29105.1 uroporphyrinogen-III synthase [Ancylobacter sp. SL191]
MGALTRILVTRPQPDAEATAARLAAAGLSALVDPLLIVEPVLEAALPAGPLDAVALTSVNGARALAARPELSALTRLPLYVVGRRTAAVAPEGFADLHVAGGDGAALVELIRRSLPRGARVLHVAGEDRAVDLGAALAGDGIGVELFVIYRAVPAPALALETCAALVAGQIDAAFHFSPRTAATLVACAQAADRAGGPAAGLCAALARVQHLCFSANVAAPLAGAGWPTRLADSPTEEGLFALLDR